MNNSQTIKTTTLFHGVEMSVIETLEQNCRQKTYAKGCEIFAMGDKAEAFFVILKGWVKLYRLSKEGEEAIIHVFGSGESFAEAAVFNDSKTYPVNAQALEETTLIEIPRRFFVQKIEEDSRFALRILGAIAARQHYLVQQIEQISTRTAPQRIGAFLLGFCHKKEQTEKGAWIIDLPYDKSIISRRMNIKPETFSRAIAKLKPHGLYIDKKKIIITDMDRLANFCDVSVQNKPC